MSKFFSEGIQDMFKIRPAYNTALDIIMMYLRKTPYLNKSEIFSRNQQLQSLRDHNYHSDPQISNDHSDQNW